MTEPTSKRPRLSAVARRSQIIEAATHLFSRHGFERVTMKMVADACTVTEPALYRYFQSKDRLYEVVLSALRYRLDIDRALKEINHHDEIEGILVALASFILETYGQNTELSRLLLLSALEGHPLAKRAFQDLRGPYVSFLARKLRELRKQGKIRDVHPEITARCFIGMVMDCSLGIHLWRDMQGRAYDPARIIRNNIPIYVAGLKT